MSTFAPDILKKLEFKAIDTYLLKHNLLTVDEYQDYLRFHNGMTNHDIVRKLLPKITKNIRSFYQALHEAVNDPEESEHLGHKELLMILVCDFICYTYICTYIPANSLAIHTWFHV